MSEPLRFTISVIAALKLNAGPAAAAVGSPIGSTLNSTWPNSTVGRLHQHVPDDARTSESSGFMIFIVQ